MATYPTNPEIPQGSSLTAVNSTNWNIFVDNINSIGADLVNARGDGQDFPGTDHTSGQATNLKEALESIRHMLAQISGEANWYDEPAGTLKSHDHSDATKGGMIPYASVGSANERLIHLHPAFAGAVQTNSLRGAAASGANTITITNGVDVASYIGRNYYQGESSQVSLQDSYIALRFTLPKDFTAWASANAIQIEYKTESVLSSDCHGDVYIYKSGEASIVDYEENKVNTSWSNIGFSASDLSGVAWAAGDVIELYLKLESRNNYDVKFGRIAFSYTS